MSDVTIRRAESPADYAALQEAQRRAWGLTDESYVLPVATMVSAHLHGGLVLGAFLPSGEAVGVSFAFLARIEGRIGLYSQLTGVVPSYQSLGLGSRMKEAQREFCRETGLPVIAWAFDPFRAGNARFNLQRLGATAGRYVFDMYGPRTDALNAGVPTDRLIVEWEVDAAPRPEWSDAEIAAMPRLLTPRPATWSEQEMEPQARESAPGPPPPQPTSRVPRADRELLEIPASMQDLRRDDPRAAERWRLIVGRAFAESFARGYRAVGFVRESATGRCYYVLEGGHRPAPLHRPGPMPNVL